MSRYTERLEWAVSRGLLLHPDIERKEVNGVFGMYATSQIPEKTILASFPADQGLFPSKNIAYPENFTPVQKYLHTAIREYQKGEDSEYKGLFLQLQNLDFLRKDNPFFYNQDQLNCLLALNKLLYKVMLEVRNLVNYQVETITSFDKSIDPDVALMLYLNFQGYAWGEIGFLPIIDCFNHSVRKGAERKLINGKHQIESRVTYAPGEEVWVSYGKKDIYRHAIDFGYFDENDFHYIDYGTRIRQAASTAFEIKVAQHTESQHNISVVEQQGSYLYKLQDPAFLNETHPSKELIRYIKNNCFQNEQELDSKKCSDSSFLKRITEIVELMLSLNKVDEFELEQIPNKLHYFYLLLKKEKQMLLNNREWISQNLK